MKLSFFEIQNFVNCEVKSGDSEIFQFRKIKNRSKRWNRGNFRRKATSINNPRFFEYLPGTWPRLTSVCVSSLTTSQKNGESGTSRLLNSSTFWYFLHFSTSIEVSRSKNGSWSGSGSWRYLIEAVEKVSLIWISLTSSKSSLKLQKKTFYSINNPNVNRTHWFEAVILYLNECM